MREKGASVKSNWLIVEVGGWGGGNVTDRQGAGSDLVEPVGKQL